MMIIGPYITKDVTIPEHTIEVLDESAYWMLDWQGNWQEGLDGDFLYAKIAFPKLVDAQRQHRLQQEAVHHDREASAKRAAKRPRRKP
jgi:hypothetical protein